MQAKYRVSNLAGLIESDMEILSKKTDLFVCLKGNFRTQKNFELFSTNAAQCFYISQIKSNDVISKELDEKLNELVNEDKEKLAITIDISLIHRTLIAQIFSILLDFSKTKTIRLSTIYSLAKYSPPPQGELPPNDKVEPVHELFSGWNIRPGLPVMTVVGLGYETDKALGAVEYLESTNSFLFLPNSSEEEYRNDILNQNHILRSYTEIENHIDYDVEKPLNTILKIDSILTGYKSEYKIVLLPFGPKIFFASALLASVANPEVSVWHVSGEEKQSLDTQDREIAATFGLACDISLFNKGT